MGVVLLFSSCTKWVDYNPREDFRITELDYLRSESDYRTMAVSAYTPLQWLNQAVPVGDIASDNAVSGGENASDVLSLQQIDDMTHTPVNVTLTELWQAAYEASTEPTTCINTRIKIQLVTPLLSRGKMHYMEKFISYALTTSFI